MAYAYDPYPYSKTYLILRERQPGVWVEMGEETVFSNHSITDDSEHGPLAVRAFLSRTRNVGGGFAVVPKDVWERITGKNPSPVAEPAA